MRTAVIHNALRLHSANELSNISKKFLISVSSLFLFAMHLPFPNLGHSGLALTFNITTWIAFSLCASIGCYQIATQNQLQYSKFTLALFISCLLLTIPMLYLNSNWQLSLPRIIALWSGMLFFVSLQQFNFKNRRQSLLWFVLLAVFIEICLGYTQLLFFVINEPFGFISTKIPWGIFANAHLASAFLTLGLSISSFLLPLQNQRYACLFLLSFPALTLPLLLMLENKTAWVTTAAVFAFFLPYFCQYLNKKRLAAWLLSIVCGVFGASQMFNHLSTEAQETPFLQHIATSFDHSEAKKQLSYQLTDMAISEPLLGFGYGQFAKEYTDFTAKQYFKNSFYPTTNTALAHPNNEALLWIIEGGALASLGLLVAFIAICLQMCRAQQTKKLANFALLIPLVLHAQTGNLFAYSFVHWLAFIILLWWIDGHSKLYFYAPKAPSRKALKITSFILPPAVITFMLLILQANYWLNACQQGGYTNPTLLNNIAAPFLVQSKIDSARHRTYFNQGLRTANPVLLKQYIDWASKIIKTRTELAEYLMLIAAYQQLNDSNNARIMMAKTQFLFPKTDISSALSVINMQQ